MITALETEIEVSPLSSADFKLAKSDTVSAALTVETKLPPRKGGGACRNRHHRQDAGGQQRRKDFLRHLVVPPFWKYLGHNPMFQSTIPTGEKQGGSA